MGNKKPTLREVDGPQQGGGGGKSKKKHLVIDDEEYSFVTELSDVSLVKEDNVAPAGWKKGKSINLKGAQTRKEGNVDDEKSLEEKVEEAVTSKVVFSGKKKSKGKKGGDAIGDEKGAEAKSHHNVGNDDEVAVIAFSGKKKKSKSSKKGSGNVFAGSSFDALGNDFSSDKDLGEKELNENLEPISVEGKKRSSKSSKKSCSLFSAVLLDEENEDTEIISKPQPVSGSAYGRADNPSLVEVDDVVVSFTGKTKSSKKNGSSAFATPEDDVTAGILSEDADVSPIDVEANDLKLAHAGCVTSETSKNKKKKKKSARTVQEDEDFDNILAEFGEALPLKDKIIDKPSESISLVEGDKEDEKQVVVESVASKKKKKKKEKEKDKKAAAASSEAEEKKEEVKNDKSKAVDKKLPKHVREMQEALARRQEAEEKMKREEEERLRKEEEERRKQEELERQAEEARLRKKEREKEKSRLKKEADKLKEEQRRFEIIRKQLFSSTGIALPLSEGGAPTKRPIYKTKKGKPHQGQTNGTKTPALEEEKFKEEKTEKMEEVGTMEVEEVANEIQENGSAKEEAKEDDEDWDAKSWDDRLALSVKGPFDDEEAASLSHLAAKKERTNAFQSVTDTTPPAFAGVKPVTSQKIMPQPTCVQTPQKKQKPSEAEAPGENKGKEALTAESGGDLRSPICCIMGHVDTGKTKLLDYIRGTNVQEGEAGGITQQIGATYFPAANIRERTRADAKLNVPGLLVIDTPGHESFINLRSRGSGLCDIAILVVDIMHGLKPQTIESLNLLKMRNTEFIVALNKVDRLYGWKTCRNAPIKNALEQQTRDVRNEFNMRLVQIVTQFKEQGLNTQLYYKIKEMGETICIVPTSAISGEGIPDMLLLLVHCTQKTMTKKLTFSNKVQCTVLEVKVIEGHGATIDVVLVNGVLHEGDQIVVCGMQGPIVTTIRALLTPHPMKELRVKGTYLHHKEIKAAQGIKITAQGLEHAIAGTGLYVVGPDDDLKKITDLAKEDMDSVLTKINKSGEGVCVQASTLGSLEALLELLKSPAVSIPVNAVSIGPVHKKDVMKAGVMLAKKIEYATILAFDVKVTPEAREYADEVGVKIFMDDTIYRLVDQFKVYIDNIKEEKKRDAADKAVFPCVLKIMPNCVFNKKDPIILGVDVLHGIAKVGTPLCIPTQGFLDIGRIKTIKNNDQFIDSAMKGQKVAIKIVSTNPEEQQKMFGRHFEIEDELVSHISRESIDTLDAYYQDDLSIDRKLVKKLKRLFKIQ